MDKRTISELVNLLDGITQSDWMRIKQQVDMLFSRKVAKVELSDTKQLLQSLEVEFNLRRFGEKSD